MHKAYCPACHKRVDYPKEVAGQEMACTHCGQAMTLPKGWPKWCKSVFRAGLIMAGVFAVFAVVAVALRSSKVEEVHTLFMAGLFAVGAVIAFLWLIFPVFMFAKMNELIKEVRKIQR